MTGAGVSTDMADNLVPMGRILQKNSPEVEKNDPNYIQGAEPGDIYIKNAHANAIPAVRAYAAEFTKESAFGPNGYLKQAGLIAAPNNIRARSQQAARTLGALNLASLK